MKPGEFTKAKYTDFAKLQKELVCAAVERFDPNKAKLRSSFEAGSTYLKKFKLEADKFYAVLIPLEICLPFHPETLSDEIFNKDNPLPLPGSPTTAVLSIKEMARNNKEFADKLAEVMSCSVKDLCIDDNFITSDKEIKVWHRLARLQYLTGTVQHLNTDSKFKFGRNIGCDPIIDDSGIITGTVGIGYQLYEMENAIISIKAQLINDSYEAGGANADRPTSERDASIKNLWKDRLIGNPYNLSFTRCIPFETDANGNLGVKTINDWKKDKKIKNMLKYMKITTDKISIFESVLGEKADTSMDFVEIRISVPAPTDSDRIDYTKVNYSTASRDNSIFRMADDDVTPLHDLKNFKEEFSKFRDNEKLWNDDQLRRSVYDFRQMTDDALIATMQESIKTYEDAMNSPSLIESYGHIISQINSTLMDEALTNIISGEDNGKEISAEIIESKPITDENSDPTDGDLLSSAGDILAGIELNDIKLSNYDA